MSTASPAPSPGEQALAAALDDANAACIRLEAQGKNERAGGLAVACDLLTSACFLHSVTEQDYRKAVELVRGAIAYATRTED